MLKVLGGLVVSFLSSSTFACTPCLSLESAVIAGFDGAALERFIRAVDENYPHTRDMTLRWVCTGSVHTHDSRVDGLCGRVVVETQPNSESWATWESIECESHDNFTSSRCKSSTGRLYIHNGNRVFVDDKVSEQSTKKVILAIAKLKSARGKFTGRDGPEEIPSDQLDSVRRIFVKDGMLTVTFGEADFFGYDIEFEAIICGKSDCALQPVAVQFWIS